MIWTIPGTVLQADRTQAEETERMFRAMFLAGDIALGQAASISGLEPYTIQNWVRRGFLSPPHNKRYSLNQLCRILNIHMLKGALPMDKICGLLTYINGRLDDERDDLIDDASLYFLFVRLAARAELVHGQQAWEAEISRVLQDLPEKQPGANQRVRQVLGVMLAAWLSTTMRQEAESLLAELKKGD